MDDEPPARDVIEVFVNRVPDLQCVAICGNAHQAIDAIQQWQPHLVFLDIQMPDMTGIDLLQLQLPLRPEIVITTAYSEHALKSYEFAVLDYLMKPISYERFMQAVVKFKQKQINPQPNWSAISPLPADEANTVSSSEQSVWLREEKRLLQIPYEEILYVEAMKDYVKVYLKEQMILTHLTIGKAEELFPPPYFIRIHRSHIVRRGAIRLIDGNLIRLVNDTELQIGPNFRDELKKYISALR
ncbi:LytTR family DNA-binding domain-containing protein [Nibrella saemangeumensis]|uniref:LytTR family DNA-binding domain-containing protein n=1 Tax=Nibrella saemangeumensis TaxID=1084526 RepID=A0ABP8N7Y7_9BACT